MSVNERALAGRRAIVTGASAGIGEAIARALAAAGASVVINARRADRLAAVAEQIASRGGRVACVSGDAGDDSVVAAMLDTCRAEFGGQADLVIVNAGRGLRGSVYDSDPSQWEAVFRVNVLAAAKLMRAASERMIGVATPQVGAPPAAKPPEVPGDWPATARDIMVLGSTVGRNLSPFSSMYGSAKAAVHMLAESLRRTCGPRGVRVTTIEPGIVASEFQSVAGYDPVSFGAFMKSIDPVLTPEDVARVVLLVASQPAGVHLNEVMMRPTRQEYP
ncbi:MAG: SDR family NAD(P)-dependent oxidoreductase [Phycisphaerales bacterium]|jgi:NADP-dependent 3-hydroxy acid dehydrogenase YdfG|nr:SDR family NAD(P)-dependent oxidoreductase [Phycisphaeraceae bacterium]